MSLAARALIPVALVVLVGAAGAANIAVVEDWASQAVGTRGIPSPWQKQRWGSPAYDFTVIENAGQKVLHLQSAGDSSNISR